MSLFMNRRTNRLDDKKKHFTVQGVKYESTLHYGSRYDSSNITISEDSHSSVSFSIKIGFTVSAEDVLMIFEAVSTEYWILNTPDREIYLTQLMVESVNFLQTQGVNLEDAIIAVNKFRIYLRGSDDEFLNQFHKFTELGYQFVSENGESNFGLYLRFRNFTSEDVACQILSFGILDIDTLLELYMKFVWMRLHKDALQYVARLNAVTMQLLFSISQVTNLSDRRHAVTLCKMLSEISESNLSKISSLIEKFTNNDRVDDVLTWADIQLFNSLGRYKGLLKRFSDFEESKRRVSWVEPLAILIVLYGIKNLDKSLTMIETSSSVTKKNFSLLIFVNNYLANNESTVYPFEWILELDEDYSEGENVYV